MNPFWASKLGLRGEAKIIWRKTPFMGRLRRKKHGKKSLKDFAQILTYYRQTYNALRYLCQLVRISPILQQCRLVEI